MNQNNYKDSMLLHNSQRKAPSDQSYTETTLINQETPLNPPQVHGVGTALNPSRKWFALNQKRSQKLHETNGLPATSGKIIKEGNPKQVKSLQALI